ncbi:MAG: glycosyltransferase family 4 protein [Leptospiraceae bacterium]|nr:glycosyltransferase family 4 protein [Leptospiraceae bacterium]MCK6380630.1 glycosyltransferase family 4 protein [Leptospiraceae bacterium]NUM41070.1 glycosyltransferase family 4 protein [Leptospiraceae bacterium]
MILGIDASNIRGGGGVTHIVELLKSANPFQYGFDKVLVWGGSGTLEKIEDRPWLTKCDEPLLNKSLPFRVYWQRFILSRRARAFHCDILFIPGSSYSGSFRPYVTLSQNLLPFEWKEMRRYGFSWQMIRLIILRILQSSTFKNADGMIFLTQYARDSVLKVIGKTNGISTIIPHGINFDFRWPVKVQKKISTYTKKKPFRILYVSTVDVYKHQDNVCEAVWALVKKGYSLRLDLVGPSFHSLSLKKLKAILELTVEDSFLYYHGSIPHGELKSWYKQADLFVFASSCENMPIILMESMVAGLPIALSNRGPMPEVLQEDGEYFDPENSFSIEKAIQKLIESPALRKKMANGSSARTKLYSWKKSSNDNFQFFQKIAQIQMEKKKNV